MIIFTILPNLTYLFSHLLTFEYYHLQKIKSILKQIKKYKDISKNKDKTNEKVKRKVKEKVKPNKKDMTREI